MEGNPTVGYSLGFLEGYLKSLAEEGQAGAEEALGYLKVLENAYIEKSSKIIEYETKLAEIRLNLDGWKKI